MQLVIGTVTQTAVEMFVQQFARFLPHRHGIANATHYLLGLFSDLPRKNSQDIAEVLPGVTLDQLQQFVADSPWPEDEVEYQRLRLLVRGGWSDGHTGVIAIDDTGFPKQGTHSVGVARQYCPELGKVANCQVVVTAQYTDPRGSWPIGARLYLPDAWVDDPVRREAAGVPATVTAATKGTLALGLIDAARAAHVRHTAITADSAYGASLPFLDGLEARHEPYIVQIPRDFGVRLPDEVASAQAAAAAGGSRPGHPRRDPSTPPLGPLQTAERVIAAQPATAWQTVPIRTQAGQPVVRQACRVWVNRATGDRTGAAGWLVAERPQPGQAGDTTYYFAWQRNGLSLEAQLLEGHARWAVDRFHEDGKQELGLGDYQGRSWTGLHRHLTLVNLAWTYAFLSTAPSPTSEGALSPPGASTWATDVGAGPRPAGGVEPPAVIRAVSHLSHAAAAAHPRYPAATQHQTALTPK